jgi:hypothetical protein
VEKNFLYFPDHFHFGVEDGSVPGDDRERAGQSGFYRDASLRFLQRRFFIAFVFNSKGYGRIHNQKSPPRLPA